LFFEFLSDTQMNHISEAMLFLTQGETESLKPKLLQFLLNDCTPNLPNPETKVDFLIDLTDYLCIIMLQPGRDILSEITPYLENESQKVFTWLCSEVKSLRTGAQTGSRFVLDTIDPLWRPL